MRSSTAPFCTRVLNETIQIVNIERGVGSLMSASFEYFGKRELTHALSLEFLRVESFLFSLF